MVDTNHGAANNNSHPQLPHQLTTSSTMDFSDRLNWRYPATVGAITTDNAQATQNMMLVRENIVVKQQDCLLDFCKATSHHDDTLSGK
jgi:hypothetical protein